MIFGYARVSTKDQKVLLLDPVGTEHSAIFYILTRIQTLHAIPENTLKQLKTYSL